MTTYNTGHGDFGIAIVMTLFAVAVVLAAVTGSKPAKDAVPVKISCESYRDVDVRDLPVSCLSYWEHQQPQQYEGAK